MPDSCPVEWVPIGRRGRGIGRRPRNYKQIRAENEALSAQYAAAYAQPPLGPLPSVDEAVADDLKRPKFASSSLSAAEAESGYHPDEAAAGSEPSWWPSSNAGDAGVCDDASDDDVASSDDEDDSDYDSDDDSDGDGEDEEGDVDEAGHVEFGVVELSPEVMRELQNPHTFRNANGVVYGFWSKCPLG
jgi:hypothetical protein